MATLNQREDKLLLDVNKKFENSFFNENIIKEAEQLPDKINKSIEKGKIIEKKMNSGKINLNQLINDCLNIENNIHNLNIIINKIKKYNNIKELKLLLNFEKKMKLKSF